MTRAALAAVLALASLFAGGAARAQSEAGEREARVLFKEANALAAKGEHARALERFRAAYALFPSAKILLNMAATLDVLGEDVEALSAYERYLADAGKDVPADERAEVEKVVADVRAELGRVTIQVNEPGATLLLDGMTVGQSPLGRAIWVKAGAHRVEARKEGFHPTSETAHVPAGGAHGVALLLARAVAEPTPVAAPAPTLAPAPPVAVATPAPRASARVALPPSQPDDRTHAGQFGLVARADADQTFRGAAAVVGATYGIGAWLEVGAGALVGPELGARFCGQVFVLRGAWKPFVAAGAGVFFVDGAHPGVRGGLGLQFDASRHLGAFIEATVEHYPGLPDELYSTFFVPSLGAQIRW